VKHFIAYNQQKEWGNGIYIDLDIKSCSKENIAVPSFLNLHTTRKTKEAISVILKKKQ